MDKIDINILKVIQKNATIPLSELSKIVGISSTPCWNRIKKMEENGTISSKITILNNKIYFIEFGDIGINYINLFYIRNKFCWDVLLLSN